MCGICGFVGSFNGDAYKVIEEMKRAIIHRGPDDDNSYIDDRVAFGFRRLAIIDLKGGAQPMANADGSKVIVFNGEIYNHEIIRQELIAKGYTYRTNSDTETLLYAYEEYGEEVLTRLRGMFAFAIYDRNTGDVFCARDHFGIKPFYYTYVDGVFVFASEIKAILEYPGVEREVNAEALEQYLSFQYSVLPETFFKGVYKLLPGHSIAIRAGNTEVKQYFDPLLTKANSDKTIERATEELDDVLANSVRAHMIADVEVGASLSSGVDSSFLASRFSGGRTYTVGFSDEDSMYNEIPYAESLCEEIGKENISELIPVEEYFDALEDIMYYMDEPLGDPSAVALYFVDKLAAKDIKVIMSGEGSDEFFGGYNIYHEPMSLGTYQKLPANFRKALAKLVRKLPKFYGRNFIIQGSKTLEERFIGNAYVFGYEDRGKVLRDGNKSVPAFEVVKPYYDKVADLDDIAKMQYIDINFWLPGDILLKADKMSMAHSLEARVPFLDTKVFGYVRDFGASIKVDDSTTKKTFRRVAKRYIPEKSAAKKKLGFPVPIRKWLMTDPYKSRIYEMLHSEVAAEYFDIGEIDKLLMDHYNKKVDNSRKIWVIFMFLIWHKVYIEGDYNQRLVTSQR